MDTKIITTKKTSMNYLISQLFSDFVFFVLGVYCGMQVDRLRSAWQFQTAETVLAISVIFLILALLSFIYHIMVASTIAEVCNDKISGKGMQGITIKSFSFYFDEIVGLSSSKGLLNMETVNGVYLVVNTSAGNYKIITSPSRANEIIDHFNSFKHGASCV